MLNVIVVVVDAVVVFLVLVLVLVGFGVGSCLYSAVKGYCSCCYHCCWC